MALAVVIVPLGTNRRKKGFEGIRRMLAENLPQSLTIKDEKLKHGLNAVELAVKNFWVDRTLLQHYTNHGLDHSERIVTVLGQLLEEHPDLLNKHERFILLASVYLHDIGMQSPTHADLEEKEEYTLKEMEQVRKNHHEASAEMILESISPEAPFLLGLNDYERYVHAIAEVARYHRKLPLENLTDTTLEGETIRLALLAALLRLGDALDADDRRVNMDFLKIRTIPTISKYHWWSHHYVQSVSARKGHIKLFFKFPERHRTEEKIIAAFREKVVESVKEAFFDVYDILDKYGLRLYRDVEIEGERYAPAGELEPIPADLLDYIAEAIIKPRESLEERTREEGVLFYVDGVPYSDDEKVVECLKKLSKLDREERYFDALKELDQCLLLTMPPKEKMIFLNIAGNCNYYLGNLAIAKKYHEDCLKISGRKDLQAIYKDIVKFTRAVSLGNIGLIYQAKGELDEALKYHQDALKIYRELGYKEGEANQLGNIGLIYRTKGELDKALKYLLGALKIHRELGYKEGEANQLGNIGLVYQAKGKLDEALKYHQDALKIAKELGHKRGEASDLGNIGLIYLTMGELDKALKYHQDALKLHRAIGHKQGEASALGNIGLIYRTKGELDKALKYHQDALKIAKELGYKEEEASALGNIGLIYQAKGELDKALKYLQDALKIFTFISPEMVVKILLYICDIYSQKQDYEKSFDYLGKVIAAVKSESQFNAFFRTFTQIVAEIVKANEWAVLEKVNSFSKIIADKKLANFFTAIHKFARYKQTLDTKHKKGYEAIRKKLEPKLKKMLDALLKE